MQYDTETIKHARNYGKYIVHKDIVDLINAINENYTDFPRIKNLLTACFNKQVRNLPIKNNTLEQETFNTFCIYVDNFNSHLVFAPTRRRVNLYTLDTVKNENGLNKINAISKIAFDEWIQETKNQLLLEPAEQPKPKTNEVEAETQKRHIDVEKLKPYFKSTFKGMGNININYFDWLVSLLQTDRSPKEFARIALMIYESNAALNNTKPNTFKGWYKIFCECVGCEQKSYQPKDLRNPPKNLTDLFGYL